MDYFDVMEKYNGGTIQLQWMEKEISIVQYS